MRRTNLLIITVSSILICLATGCNAIQREVGKATTRTVAVTEMCNSENIGQKVRVVGLLGTAAFDTSVIQKPDGALYGGFYLQDRRKSEEESQEEIRRTGNVLFPDQRVQLRRGMSKALQIIVLDPFLTSVVKTKSGETVPVTEQLAFTGKVVSITTSHGKRVCQLEDVTIEKP